MTSEDYVNKELMPLLLEKGCFLDKVFVQDFRPIWYTKESNNPTWQDCDAYYIPTQSQVLKWLREVHKIYIEICTDKALNLKDIVFRPAIFNKELNCLWESDNHPIYEEACEAAIKYCLENLI